MEIANKAYSYIRFSSEKQSKGDSYRRQIELSKAYAREHGYIWDDSLKMADLGFSAYDGANIEKGALGDFLDKIKSHKIPEGSVLIVESLDRLSRQSVDEAYDQFRAIIKAGIKIVTLQDNKTYTKEGLKEDWLQLFGSLSIMARAHDESDSKSIRLKAAWVEKRRKMRDNKIATKKTPAWIKVSGDSTHFELIPEVCEAIELIYRMKLEGIGSAKMERLLNCRDDIWRPPISKRNKSGGWRKSYINKLLINNRQLIGEYQPHEIKNGKRVPIDNPIPTYYPKAIDEELFVQVQNVITLNSSLGRAGGLGGGRSDQANNLFTYIIKCGYCGHPMHFFNKGKLPKGGRILYCDASRRKLENGSICNTKSIRYDEFEELMLEHIENINIDNILPQDNELLVKINSAKTRLDALDYKRKENRRKETNLTRSISTTDNYHIRKSLEEELGKVLKEGLDLLEERKATYAEYNKLTNLREETKETINIAKELSELLNRNRGTPEEIKLRFALRKELLKLIEYIKVYPHVNLDEKIKYKEALLKKYQNSMSDEGKDKIINLKTIIRSMRKRITELKKEKKGDFSYKKQNKYIDYIRIKYKEQNKTRSTILSLTTKIPSHGI